MEGNEYSLIYGEEKKQRLDVVMAKMMEEYDIGSSRSWLKTAITKGMVTVNGVVANKGGQKVKKNDVIKVSKEVGENSAAKSRETEFFDLKPNHDIELDIVYEDEEVVVLNKPKNIVMHPSTENGKNLEDSLVNALLAKYGKEGLSSSEDGTRPGIVHRLDVETSGLVVITRTDEAYQHVHAQFRDRKKEMKRSYVALVAGSFGKQPRFGTVDGPIGRHPKHGTKRCVFEKGNAKGQKNVKEAITHWKVLKEWDDVALVQCDLETGRTHQIRVHMKHIHHPLLCDSLYGPGNMPCAKVEKKLFSILKKHEVSGQFLHAKTLSFEHPKKKEMLMFESDYPEYWNEAFEILDRSSENYN